MGMTIQGFALKVRVLLYAVGLEMKISICGEARIPSLCVPQSLPSCDLFASHNFCYLVRNITLLLISEL